ncbi:MAG: carboxypeptidase-like regulatory domain-containing protein [Candidatus Sulfotelmatobacter sp.]
MTLRSVRSDSAFILVLIVVLTSLGYAQETAGTISGTVTGSSGKAVAGAKVSVVNKASGQSSEAETDSDGHYTILSLAPGDYEVAASEDGSSATGAVSVTAGGQQTLSLTLTPSQAPSQNLPSAPAPQKTEPQQNEPSLSDLGFAPTETKANPREQALLDKRTHMLKIHQRMGLITTIPMVASVITSLNAGGRNEGSTSRDLHVALGALTGDLYGITAYYAIRAPRIPGTQTRGQIKFHKAMAWIHGPGMILTPILGAMAFSQKNNGEKVHGLASAHGPVAIVTAGAFGAALLSVSVKF